MFVTGLVIFAASAVALWLVSPGNEENSAMYSWPATIPASVVAGIFSTSLRA